MESKFNPIAAEYLAAAREFITRLDEIDKKNLTFAKLRLAEMRIAGPGAGAFPIFVRFSYIDELIAYPMPASAAPVVKNTIENLIEHLPPEVTGLQKAYRLPVIKRESFTDEEDYWVKMEGVELPSRYFFYSACQFYFSMGHKEVNPLVPNMNLDDKETRINAWKIIIRYARYEKGKGGK